MAISKESRRVQFTLNASKEKEMQIANFLDGCLNPNSTIKEIIYSYIVSNYEYKSPQVTHSEVAQSYAELPKVSDFKETENNIVSDSDTQLLKVSNCEEKSREVTELEMNELEELNNFI